MEQKENILKELVKTRNILKKKLHSIKTNEADTHLQLRDTFKPITDPLKELIDKSNKFSSTSKEGNDVFKGKSGNKKSFSRDIPSTSTPNKYKEEAAFSNSKFLNDNVDDADDDDDEFYSQSETPQNINTKETYADLQLLEMNHELDNIYGPHKDINNVWKFGNSNIILTDDKIHIGHQIWALTPGLFSLIFHKTPKGYDKSELEIYKKILINTNAHKRDYKADEQIKGTRAYKYKHIIGKLFKKKSQKNLPISSPNATKSNYMGDGLMKFNSSKPNYIYWDDPNELVDRLRLLLASQVAGHTNHNNEIVSIIEELHEANIID